MTVVEVPGVDELYGLAPEDFVEARDSLARRLRSDGQREAAAAVKQLRRPTVAAWAVNQLARRHADDLRRLIARGRELQAAQQQALEGQAGQLRTAVDARRDTIRRLARAAEQILGERDGGAHGDEVVATLTAASVDPDAATQVLAGRLTTPLRAPTGFVGGPTAEPGRGRTPRRPPARPSAGRRARPEGEERARRRAEEARRAADEARARADDAARAADEAAQAARRSAARVRQLEDELERARRVAAHDAGRAADAAARADGARRRSSDAEDQARRAAPP
jgi:hypothetical protein